MKKSWPDALIAGWIKFLAAGGAKTDIIERYGIGKSTLSKKLVDYRKRNK